MTFDISSFLDQCGFPDFTSEKNIAAALSGGPDSLALSYALSRWSEKENGPDIHCVTVDHGLRAGSADEAKAMQVLVETWPKARHETLVWEGPKPESRFMEEAREARYTLLLDYCECHNIRYLFFAHHLDDQAETVLFRLAKGSGLDGLAAMRALQDYKSIKLVRPLLGVPKQALIDFCEHNALPYIQDPSNDSEAFARVRLRQSMDVLQREGLTPERLALLAQRLDRASNALQFYAEKAWHVCFVEGDAGRTVLKKDALLEQPHEVILRVVSKALAKFSDDQGYGPRMSKVEDLVSDLIREDVFRKRTLGGAVILRDDAAGLIVVSAEKT